MQSAHRLTEPGSREAESHLLALQRRKPGGVAPGRAAEFCSIAMSLGCAARPVPAALLASGQCLANSKLKKFRRDAIAPASGVLPVSAQDRALGSSSQPQAGNLTSLD